MNRGQFASIAAAVLLLAACGGNDRDGKNSADMAIAIKNSGVALTTEPQVIFVRAERICDAIGTSDQYSAVSPYIGKGGERPMRAAIAYLCPDKVEGWDTAASIARDLG